MAAVLERGLSILVQGSVATQKTELRITPQQDCTSSTAHSLHPMSHPHIPNQLLAVAFAVSLAYGMELGPGKQDISGILRGKYLPPRSSHSSPYPTQQWTCRSSSHSGYPESTCTRLIGPISNCTWFENHCKNSPPFPRCCRHLLVRIYPLPVLLLSHILLNCWPDHGPLNFDWFLWWCSPGN